MSASSSPSSRVNRSRSSDSSMQAPLERTLLVYRPACQRASGPGQCGSAHDAEAEVPAAVRVVAPIVGSVAAAVVESGVAPAGFIAGAVGAESVERAAAPVAVIAAVAQPVTPGELVTRAVAEIEAVAIRRDVTPVTIVMPAVVAPAVITPAGVMPAAALPVVVAAIVVAVRVAVAIPVAPPAMAIAAFLFARAGARDILPDGRMLRRQANHLLIGDLRLALSGLCGRRPACEQESQGHSPDELLEHVGSSKRCLAPVSSRQAESPLNRPER